MLKTNNLFKYEKNLCLSTDLFSEIKLQYANPDLFTVTYELHQGNFRLVCINAFII